MYTYKISVLAKDRDQGVKMTPKQFAISWTICLHPEVDLNFLGQLNTLCKNGKNKKG